LASAVTGKIKIFQAHRRVIGFIGVVQATAESEQQIASQHVPDETPNIRPERKYSDTLRLKTTDFSRIKEQYDSSKAEYEATVVDARCIVIGYPEESLEGLWSSRELFCFKNLDEADALEVGIRDFLRSIYYVLESRRLDLSFEKLDCPPCPVIPAEQKYRQGLENKNSKIYRLV
uniref:PH domain-containing protein n=1 Tax=Gongylonema pulchrum TaxID=637853 RepID=A0A183D3R6_9BILA